METTIFFSDINSLPVVTTPFATDLREMAKTAFAELRAIFSSLIFDVRKSNFHDIQRQFFLAKQRIETLLNANLAADLKKLAREFNRLAVPVCSNDNNKFEVMARVGRQGKIELMFVEF